MDIMQYFSESANRAKNLSTTYWVFQLSNFVSNWQGLSHKGQYQNVYALAAYQRIRYHQNVETEQTTALMNYWRQSNEWGKPDFTYASMAWGLVCWDNLFNATFLDSSETWPEPTYCGCWWLVLTWEIMTWSGTHENAWTHPCFCCCTISRYEKFTTC